MSKKQFNEEELLKRVEEAASKGAKKSGRFRWDLSGVVRLVQLLLTVCILGGLVYGYNQFTHQFDDITKKIDPVADHDMTIDNNGIWGFTVADFQDAILGKASQMKLLEVYTRDVEDTVTITDAGFAGWAVFSKSQLLTYHGTATYVVDLSKLNKDSVYLNKDAKKVLLYIPHVQLQPINIQSEDIEYGQVENGLLSWGKIKLTPEEMGQVQTSAQKMMKNKLLKEQVNIEADRFAKLSIWEIYQPIVTSVAPGYTLEILFE